MVLSLNMRWGNFLGVGGGGGGIQFVVSIQLTTVRFIFNSQYNQIATLYHT